MTGCLSMKISCGCWVVRCFKETPRQGWTGGSRRVLTMMTRMGPVVTRHCAEVTHSGVHIQNTAEAETRNCRFALKCANADH